MKKDRQSQIKHNRKETEIINIILDKLEFRAKVLNLTKRVHFMMLNDSIHGEEALPEENYKNNFITIY